MPVAAISPARRVDLKIVTVPSWEASRDLAAAEARRRFDLARDLMIRALLARVAPNDHVLLLARHHIASDGWSAEVLLRELSALYAGAPLEDLPFQYGDYARWQIEQHAAGAFDAQLAYWKERLAGSPSLLRLPLDGPRPPRQTFRGARESFVVSPDLVGALKELARREGATLFMVLLAVFQTLLQRYSGAQDILVGCPVAGRGRIEFEPLVGLFMNTLVLRTDFSGDPPFRELLARVRETALGAYAHQDLPFEKLVEALQPERSLSYPPVFQVLFQLRNLPFAPPHFAELACEPLDLDPGTTQFDLAMEITPAGASLQCALTCNTDLFERETARRIAGHYRNLLVAASQDSERPVTALPMLGSDERRQLLTGWNQTERPLPSMCVHETVSAQAGIRPGAVAVVDQSGELTYSGLVRAADTLAHRLRRLGVGPGVLVALCVERSRAMVVAVLAILKAGGAYLPLDPLYPKKRLAFTLVDSGAAVLITESAVSARLPEQLPAVVLMDALDESPAGDPGIQTPAGPESPAYAIYTSGSTGTPKAVVVPHRALTNVLESLRSEFAFGEHDRMLAVSTLSFDIAAVEIFLPLICGGTVAIASRLEQGDGRALSEAIERMRPTFMQATPAAWGMLIDSGWRGSEILTATCGGEAMTRPLAGALLARSARVFNLYGPTETAIVSTIEKVRAGTQPVPIGRPLANTRVYVLDDRLEPVPQGVSGELYIAGAGVALGYWKRPELTAERFLPDPFTNTAGATMYKTGDLGRWLPDGRLEYLGRRDAQVKLRGFRIEPGEVETALATHPNVRAAAVTVSGGALVAWCVWREAAVEPGALREFLAARLPQYMIPARFVTQDSLPLLPNGKLDRCALAGLAEPPPPARTSARPRDDTERRLASIWEELLGSGPVGIDDHFFELGGHSLLAACAAARIEEAFGRRLPVATLFEAPTIAQLAAHVRGDAHPVWPPRVIPIQPAGTRTPFWAIGGGSGYRAIAGHLGPDQPVFGVLLEDADAARFGPPYRVETIGTEIVRVIRQQQPAGPYQLGGHSLQGLFAFEAARQLLAEGEDVSLLALFDTYLPVAVRLRFPIRLRFTVHAASAWWLLSRGRVHDTCAFALTTAKALAARASHTPARTTPPAEPVGPTPIREVLRLAGDCYQPQWYPGRIVFLEAADQPIPLHLGSRLGWTELAGGGLDVRAVPGSHATILEPPNAAAVAESLMELLDAGEDGSVRIRP